MVLSIYYMYNTNNTKSFTFILETIFIINTLYYLISNRMLFLKRVDNFSCCQMYTYKVGITLALSSIYARYVSLWVIYNNLTEP